MLKRVYELETHYLLKLPWTVVVQPHSHVQLFVTPWTAAHQASLSFTISQSLPNSGPLSQWCHPTISSSFVPFSSCLQLPWTVHTMNWLPHTFHPLFLNCTFQDYTDQVSSKYRPSNSWGKLWFSHLNVVFLRLNVSFSFNTCPGLPTTLGGTPLKVICKLKCWRQPKYPAVEAQLKNVTNHVKIEHIIKEQIKQ